MNISIAHSPDADDYFLFWALQKKMLAHEPFEFSFAELDTEDLNRSARAGKYDVCAVSVAAYPDIADQYMILSSGASVGRGYGPTLVSGAAVQVEDLQRAVIGIPGFKTTAAAVLRRLVPDASFVEIPLSPYRAVFDALETGRVEAAVLIHEGQIAYAEENLHLVTDLGKWWLQRTGLPLPLGINVIRKALGKETVDTLARLFSESVRYAREHVETILPELFDYSQAQRGKLREPQRLKHYLDLYANADSIELAPDCQTAIALLCGEHCLPEFTP
jgi:1,4-dihydroxy-6-naphthoate synthase